jgi:uncharacterized protein involved in exopolysaccharide biosynthesis
MPDPTNQQTGENGAQPPTPQRPHAEDEVSLLDILLVIARNKRLILWITGIVTFLGLSYAMVAPLEYTSTARVIREAPSDAPQGISGGLSALRGLGISVGGAASGLTPEAYPDLLTSREVRLAVVRDTFYFPEVERRMTYVEYVSRPAGLIGTIVDGVKRYTIGLPGTIMQAVNRTPSRSVGVDSTVASVFPTEMEEQAMKSVKDVVTSSVNPENGLMSISVTADSPVFAAEMADSFLQHLSARVSTIRTEKARRNLAFIEKEFAEAERELRAAEEQLAAFMDRNQGISSERLRNEQERLRRQVQFKSDLYSELQTQLTQAQIELQRSEPILTVIERPVPPMTRSAPNRMFIVLISLVVGVFIGISVAFVKTFFENTEEDAEEQEKLEEIKKGLVPARLAEFMSSRQAGRS